MLKRATRPGSGYRICTDTAGVKVPCATVTPSRRVAGFPRRARKIMNTKAKRIVVACLSRLSTLSLGGCPSFRAVSYSILVLCQMRSNITKGRSLVCYFMYNTPFGLITTLDTHHPAITREQCEYYLPFRAGAGGGLAPPEGLSLLSCTRPGREVKPANLPVWRLGSGPLHATRKPTRELNPADGQSGDPSWALCPPVIQSPGDGMDWLFFGLHKLAVFQGVPGVGL